MTEGFSLAVRIERFVRVFQPVGLTRELRLILMTPTLRCPIQPPCGIISVRPGLRIAFIRAIPLRQRRSSRRPGARGPITGIVCTLTEYKCLTSSPNRVASKISAAPFASIRLGKRFSWSLCGAHRIPASGPHRLDRNGSRGTGAFRYSAPIAGAVCFGLVRCGGVSG